jgi:hypothetical protein
MKYVRHNFTLTAIGRKPLPVAAGRLESRRALKRYDAHLGRKLFPNATGVQKRPDGCPGTHSKNVLIGDARPDDALQKPDNGHALGQSLHPNRIKPLTPTRRQSSFSISLEIASGFVTEPNRVITLPSLSTRNFVKFHLMPSVPSTPGASSVR